MVCYMEKSSEIGNNLNKTVKINYKNPNLANIESVVLPDTVKSIMASAFDNCTKLKHIELPDELYGIGDSAFRDTALTEIELPEKLNYINLQMNAFA